ncbi:uncharacterized protein FIESC28_10824 [Fusarium coffeatum]|uniref:DUF7025 domain-containing protein n=1 Tax=Fusarium coffeatum TaxID=231269 RepID=A0A366QS45_9HYPO|nr:uncharacterized protein FIESC28_10824 [Fusarium coffeatum]RBR07078.1 hypothetical protein FIESC28_10824 [Fusarium coffeatum]
MAASELSNFQRFQQILKKPPLAMVGENDVTESKLPAPPPQAPSWDGTTTSQDSYNPIYDPREPDETSSIVPFLQETAQWDKQSQRYLEHAEIPDESWTVWKAIEHNKKPKAWIRHQKTFDKLGVKILDRLLIRADDATLRFLNEKGYPFSGLDASIDRDDTGIFRRNFNEERFYRRSENAEIDEKLFRNLFLRYNDIQEKIEATSLAVVRRILITLIDFLDYYFPGARQSYQDACSSGTISFSHLWTLFRPGDISYEKHTIAPFQDVYEQCFGVDACEESVSQYDGTRVLLLRLAEITYSPGQHHNPGPRMGMTTRHIREYDGVKQVTVEDLGIIPFSLMEVEKQDAIRAKLVQRGRRFFQVSKLPFSFWNYKGPYTIVHSLTGKGTIEEARLSSAERHWQKHTHENVVIDITTSKVHFGSRFYGELESYNSSEFCTKREDPRVIPPIDVTNDDPTTEMLLLICRGHLPGYMLSSSVYAVGILVSELRPPMWAPQPLPSVTASLLPDSVHWRGLVHCFLGGSEKLEVDLGQRQTQGSGLVLSLEGSKIIARKVANEISGHLEKPLLCITILDHNLKLEEITKAALRWGAILFIEFRNMPPNQFPYKSLDLRNLASFYPSVMLISCTSTKELGAHCEEMIDSVISCRLPSKNEPTALWELAIAEQTPDLSTDMSGKQLSEICQFLAQLEICETRMEKILKTAKRMAAIEKVRFSLEHVVAVIRLSVYPDKLTEFEGVMGTPA